MRQLDRDDALALPERLPFRRYALRAAERGAVALTLTGEDFAALAAMAREAEAIMARFTLDGEALAEFSAPAVLTSDPSDVLSRYDSLIAPDPREVPDP